MRKVYSKPTIQMESFEMDIDIMAMTQSELEAWKFAFVSVYGREPVDDTEFMQFLVANGYDDATSGGCYFSAVQPS